VSVGLRLKSFFRRKKIGIIREARFTLIVFLWVGFYVLIMRNRWTQLEERQLQKTFIRFSEDAFSRFEARLQFWDLQARKLTSFAAAQPLQTVNLQKDSWAAIYDSHPEWLASYLVARRDGFEATVTLSLVSKQAKRWIPRETDAPVRWEDEAQSSAIQMTASKQANKPLFIQKLRSLDKDNQWLQILYKVKSPKPEWSFWIVHTFNEKILPELLEKTENHSAALYFPKDRKFFFSENFQKLKIEQSELISVLDTNKTSLTGFSRQEFAIAKKSAWLSWKHSKELESALITILPHNKIPSTGQRESPSLFSDWLLSLLWLIFSAIALWWSHANHLWLLNLDDSAKPPPSDPQVLISTLFNSKFRHNGPPTEQHPLIDAEWEFCRQMLGCSGPAGKVKLSGNSEASVETSPSKKYKGSWWIIQNIDDNRLFIAVGDATGAGLTAAATAFPVRQTIYSLLQSEPSTLNTEKFLSQLYTRCSDAASGVLMGNAHVAMFAAIIEIPQLKLCFLNAGYPAPLLKISSKKSLSLMSYFDPVGLGESGNPFPRWISLSEKANLTICNVGARNTDLDELADSELIKIRIHPYGVRDQAQTIPAAEAA
jgi:hypothetical protein